MGYVKAIEKAWEDVLNLTKDARFSVKLLSDVYEIDLNNRTVFSASCNMPAKDYISIICLHYLAQKLKLTILPDLTGEWIGFNQLDGGEGYYPAFKKRTIDHIVKKYGADPDELLKVIERLPAKKASVGDIGVTIAPFDNVLILVTMWRQDDEFEPSADILFDKNISKILCTEDIVVLTEHLVHQL